MKCRSHDRSTSPYLASLSYEQRGLGWTFPGASLVLNSWNPEASASVNAPSRRRSLTRAYSPQPALDIFTRGGPGRPAGTLSLSHPREAGKAFLASCSPAPILVDGEGPAGVSSVSKTADRSRRPRDDCGFQLASMDSRATRAAQVERAGHPV